MVKKDKAGKGRGDSTEDRMSRKPGEVMGLWLSLVHHSSKADLQTNLFLGFTNRMDNY